MKCCICSQIAGDSENDAFAKAVGSAEYVRRVVAESDGFAAIPSLGPLVPGHVIVCPKDHFRSFALVPASRDREFEEFSRQLKAALERVYSAPVHLFEHGMRPDGTRILCTVDHAHVHFVPAAVSITRELRPYPRLAVSAGLAALREVVEEDEYLMYENPEGERWAIRARDHEFGSQFLRRAFSQALGHDDWNWRESPKAQEAQRTFEILRDALAADLLSCV